MKWANIRNYISWKTKKNDETWNKIRIDLIQYTTLKKQFEVLKNFAELQQLQKIEYFLKSSTNESKMFVSPKKFCSKHIPYFYSTFWLQECFSFLVTHFWQRYRILDVHELQLLNFKILYFHSLEEISSHV